MGTCSNVKKSPRNEMENQLRQENKPEEIKKIVLISLEDEEFKDMEEWEGMKKFKNNFILLKKVKNILEKELKD